MQNAPNPAPTPDSDQKRASRPPARLVLADGRCFEGLACGAGGDVVGEVCFNTSLTGYQEILTDPSYAGQIVVLTAVQVGNYGTTPEDDESRRVWASGLIVREASRLASNWRSRQPLREYLAERAVVAADEMDTRAIVRHIRTAGAMTGVLTTRDEDLETLRARAAAAPTMEGQDLASVVTCERPYAWTEGFGELGAPMQEGALAAAERKRRLASPEGSEPSGGAARPRVVVVDFGVKLSILRSLVETGFEVEVVPGGTPAEAVLERNPDGVCLSNGPGDPAAVAHGIALARAVTGRLPILGICLGHQILGLSAGARTYKLKFGHRGGNQPVRDLLTGKVSITSHNHGFSVDAKSVGGSGFDPWFENLNDGTCEGLIHRELPILSVQFHPEAAPGPHDVAPIFRQFRDLIEGAQAGERAPTPRQVATQSR